MASLLKTNVYV